MKNPCLRAGNYNKISVLVIKHYYQPYQELQGLHTRIHYIVGFFDRFNGFQKSSFARFNGTIKIKQEVII
jgi:hypothetical protein